MPVQVRTKNLIYLVALWLMAVAPAWSDMLVSPTRALMDANNRSATLILRNTADGARTYRLSWQDKRVDAEGDYELVPEGDAWPSAAEMVRFSPRQITVGPGENQTVRLNFRPPSDLKAGEYRSHLLLKVIGEESAPSGVIEMDAPEREGIGVRLFMQLSFSIPVIARYKVSEPEVSIDDVNVIPASGDHSMRLAVALARQGESSGFGKLVVEMQKDANSPVEVIGLQKEVHVFHEVDRKVIRVALRDSAIPKGAWIRVAYEGIAEYEGQLWDEKIFQSK